MVMQRYGGISRYYYELLTHINKTDEATADAFCVRNNNAYFKNYFNGVIKTPLRGIGFVNRMFIRGKIKNYDIIHPTYYNPYLIKRKNGKLVITVYDMIHELFADMFPKDDKTAQYKKRLIYAADHIIAISESTKKDILKLYSDIPENKISVIYLASNMSGNDNKITLPERFILFVGNRGGYKNFIPFLRSVKPIIEKDAGLYLVCIGGGAFSEEEKTLISNISGRIIQKNVFDAELAYAYSQAICFVFPSLYEGFGIPTLEAFGCNCPVVLSNISSMPEVGGDAAVYFDPTDEEDMHNKILQVVYNERLRNEMIEKGRKQLSKFSWDNTAAQTIKCYKKVLGR